MTSDVLPSWSDCPARTAIIDFVSKVTNKGGPDYVPPSERIATFDNDGTLWCEQPMQVQLFFLLERVKHLAEKYPDIKDRQPFKAFLAHDMATLHSLGKRALMELAFATHAGMTEDDFEKIARAWLETATHPKFQRLFKHCTYQPQIELLDYLREHDFKIFIVSGGGIDFIRAFAEEAYGIPRECVVGSSAKLHFEMQSGQAVLMKVAELNSFDDRDVKPQNIGLHIGRRPILAFGNSDGDLAMLRYVKTGPGARLALLLHHDDGVRETAYGPEFKLSPLMEALERAAEYGITVVSMRNDWRAVFGDA
ncbi:HAD family hydrolase [Bradyrhizobium sp. SYSU BS000235]|uniref:HAD family hydrolase n=1 Tax=Bradyrhizobium sp. SYSU BS000235 TaxID=3411332 RepID=UPI003C71CD99